MARKRPPAFWRPGNVVGPRRHWGVRCDVLLFAFTGQWPPAIGVRRDVLLFAFTGHWSLFSRHSPLVPRSLGSAAHAAHRAGYPWFEQMGRKKSRKVRATRSVSSQKRSEPAAHPCRGPGGQAGDEHGGSPWFKGTRGRGTRAPVPATGSGEPLGTEAEPGPSLSDGVRGPSHPPGGCSVTRPPSCCVTRPRAWSQASIPNRFASLLAGG